MEARLAAMEQLVRKLTTEVEFLWKENETLRGSTNKPKNDVEPSNNENIGSRNAGGGGDPKEEMKNM